MLNIFERVARFGVKSPEPAKPKRMVYRLYVEMTFEIDASSEVEAKAKAKAQFAAMDDPFEFCELCDAESDFWG